MGNTKNKRVETTSHLTPGSEKIGPKIKKTKKSTPLRQTINKKNNKALDKQRRKTRAHTPPTIDDAVHCPNRQSLYPQAEKVACSPCAGRRNANGLGPAARVPPRAMPGASVGAENRGSSPTSCPACTPRPFYLLH